MYKKVTYSPSGTTITLDFVPTKYIGIGGGYSNDSTTRFYMIDLETCTGIGMTGLTYHGPTTYDTETNKTMRMINLTYTLGTNKVTLQQNTKNASGWLFYK